MSTQVRLSPILMFLVGGGGLVLIIAGLRQTAEILNPLLLAWVVAICVVPLLGWLQARGVPGWLALLLVIAIVLGLLIALIAFLGISVAQLAQALPTYQEQAQAGIANLQTTLAQLGLDISGIVSLDFLQPEKILGLLGAVVAAVVSALSNAVFMLLIIIFLLIEAAGFPAKLRTKVRSDDHPILGRFGRLHRDLRSYVWITTATGMLAGALDAVLLIIVGVDFPILWGVLAWLLSYIPSLGFWLALIPPTLLALLESGPVAALIVFLGYVLINGGVENGLKPRVMERGLNLSPLVTILSLFFWAWVLGPAGALLAVPLTMAVIKLVLESSESSRWLVDLLGGAGEVSESPEPAAVD